MNTILILNLLVAVAALLLVVASLAEPYLRRLRELFRKPTAWERLANSTGHPKADPEYWVTVGPNKRKIAVTDEAIAETEARAERLGVR